MVVVVVIRRVELYDDYDMMMVLTSYNDGGARVIMVANAERVFHAILR